MMKSIVVTALFLLSGVAKQVAPISKNSFFAGAGRRASANAGVDHEDVVVSSSSSSSWRDPLSRTRPNKSINNIDNDEEKTTRPVGGSWRRRFSRNTRTSRQEAYIGGPRPKTKTQRPFSSRRMMSGIAEEDNDIVDELNDFDDDDADLKTNSATGDDEGDRRIVVRAEIELPFSVDVAFDAYSNLPRQATWSPWLRSVEFVAKDKTVWRMKRIMGIPLSWTALTTRYERPYALEWKSITGLQNFGAVAFEAIDDNNSRISLSLSFVAPRFAVRFFGGENGRLAKIVQNRLIYKTLVLFRDRVLEEDLGIIVDDSMAKEEEEKEMTLSASSSFSKKQYGSEEL